MSDLTAKDQKAVRTAPRFLRLRVGAWGPLRRIRPTHRDDLAVEELDSLVLEQSGLPELAILGASQAPDVCAIDRSRIRDVHLDHSSTAAWIPVGQAK